MDESRVAELNQLYKQEQQCKEELEKLQLKLNEQIRIASFANLIGNCSNDMDYFNSEIDKTLENTKSEIEEKRKEILRLNNIKQLINNTSTDTKNSKIKNFYDRLDDCFARIDTDGIIGGILALIIVFFCFDNDKDNYEVKYNADSHMYGFVSLFGREKIPYLYDNVAENDNFSDNIYWVKKDGMWGAINKKNETVIPFEYQDGESNNKSITVGFTSLKKDGNWGLIDSTGKEIIPFVYDEKLEFKTFNSEICISVGVKDKKYGVIDINNKIIIPFEFDFVGYNSWDAEQTFFTARKDERWYNFDLYGNIMPE